VAERSQTEGQITTTSPKLPDTSPQPFQGSDYSFTLQAVLEVQRSLGKLENAIINLADQSQKHGDKLDKLSHKISMAQGGVWVIAALIAGLGSAVAFLLNKIIPLLHISPHP